MKIKATVELTDKRMADLLCCGMEGGIGYWARIVDYVEPEEVWEGKDWEHERGVYKHIHWPMSKGGAVIFCDAEDPDEKPCWRLDRKKMEAGLQLMAEQYPRHFANFINENEDAETGDVFVQLAVLKELVYG